MSLCLSTFVSYFYFVPRGFDLGFLFSLLLILLLLYIVIICICVWGCCFAYVYGVAVSLIPNKPSFRANKPSFRANKPSFRANKSYDDYVYMCGVAGVRGCGGAGVLLPGLHVGWRRVGLVCLVWAFLSCLFRFEFLFYLEFPVDLSAAGVGQPPLRQPPFAPRVLSLAPPLPPHTLSCTYTLTQ